MSFLDGLKKLWPSDLLRSDTDFYVTLSVNEQKFQASGENLLDVFTELSENKLIPKTKLIVTVERGGFVFHKILYVLQTRRFLANATVRMVIAKQMEVAINSLQNG